MTPKRRGWSATSKGTRQSRGYGAEHDRKRKEMLQREPLCRECRKRGIATIATIADHITPKAEGGTDDADNYQPLCKPCSDRKTALEGRRAQRRGDNAGRIWPAR